VRQSIWDFQREEPAVQTSQFPIAARRILPVHPYVRVMKIKTFGLASLFTTALLLAAGICAAQPTAPPPPGVPQQPAAAELVRVLQQSLGRPQSSQPTEPAPKFDLDFPGGTPQQLVAAVEKATGQPLNAIIPEQDKDVMLPALKMRQVTVEDLFVAMEQASRRTETYVTGTYYSGGGEPRSQYSQAETSSGFRKVGGVWIFSNKKINPPPDQVLVKTRFYQLEPYLSGNTVEDITTAIQTAWKMMAENKSAPKRNSATELKFHKETGLLIAVGDATQVQMIDEVLSALRPDLNPPVKPGQPTRKPNATPKTTPNEP
jgi:hypothetical protein